MKTYLAILQFARPYLSLAPLYFVCVLLSVLFGLFNFTLFIPLLNILFGVVEVPETLPEAPPFRLSVEFVLGWFDHLFLSVVQAEGKVRALQFVCALAVGCVLLKNLFRYLATVQLGVVRVGVVRRIRERVFEHLTRLHTGYFKEQRRGDLISRLTNDVQEIENSVVSSFTVVFREPATILGYFAALFYMSVQLTAFTLVVLPLSAWVISSLIKRLKRHAREVQEALGDLTGTVEETITGIKIIKAFNAEGFQRRRFFRQTRAYARALFSMLLRQYAASPLSETLSVTVVAGILLYGGTLVLRAESPLNASEFITYIVLFSQILSPAKAVSTAFSNIQRGLAAGERVLELLQQQPEIANAPQARPVERLERGIEFQGVHFGYEPGQEVLRGVSFTLPKGKLVALVGPSGGGKTTIADLLARFYDPWKGRILLDGVDLREVELFSFRKLVGIVTQEPVLFHDTIYNNIAFGRQDATPEEVVQAARIANAHDFILEFERGYDTVIGDQGLRLSGGQRQRITIARAVLHNPQVLILDEATSALDADSERQVQEALQHLLQGRTSLVIAHRLSTVQHADEILVVVDGRIVERGTHQDLLNKSNGIYRRLQLIQQG